MFWKNNQLKRKKLSRKNPKRKRKMPNHNFLRSKPLRKLFQAKRVSQLLLLLSLKRNPSQRLTLRRPLLKRRKLSNLLENRNWLERRKKKKKLLKRHRKRIKKMKEKLLKLCMIHSRDSLLKKVHHTPAILSCLISEQLENQQMLSLISRLSSKNQMNKFLIE